MNLPTEMLMLVGLVRRQRGWLGTVQTSRCFAGRRLGRKDQNPMVSQRIFLLEKNKYILPICFTIFLGFGAPKNVVLIVLFSARFASSTDEKTRKFILRVWFHCSNLFKFIPHASKKILSFSRCPGVARWHAGRNSASSGIAEKWSGKRYSFEESPGNEVAGSGWQSAECWEGPVYHIRLAREREGKKQRVCFGEGMAKLKAFADDIHGEDDDTEWDLGCPNFETAPILTWHLGFRSFDASLVAGFARVIDGSVAVSRMTPQWRSFQFRAASATSHSSVQPIFQVPRHAQHRTPWARCVSCWRIPIGSWVNGWISRCRCRFDHQGD